MIHIMTCYLWILASAMWKHFWFASLETLNCLSPPVYGRMTSWNKYERKKLACDIL